MARPHVSGLSTPSRGVPSPTLQKTDAAKDSSVDRASEGPRSAALDAAATSLRSSTAPPTAGSTGVVGSKLEGQAQNTTAASAAAAPATVDRVAESTIGAMESRLSFSTSDDLPAGGTRFMSGGPTRSEIAELFPDKGGAQQPVRIYVGTHHAQAQLSARARARFAFSKLKGSGAFKRGRVMIAASSGGGMVNELPVRAAEFLSMGDIATVSIQYSEEPSLLSMGKVEEGAQSYAELLKLIGGELKQMKARGQSLPEVHLYGENIGARVLQQAMIEHGVDGLEAVNVKGALLLDDPTHELVENLVEDSPRRFGQFTNVKQMPKALDAEQLKYVFLTSNESLPKRLGLDLIWSKPKKWPKGKAFLFLFTFLYLIGMLPGEKPDPGEMDQYKQEEREDLPEFVNRAFGFRSLKSDVKKVLEKLKKRKKSLPVPDDGALLPIAAT